MTYRPSMYNRIAVAGAAAFYLVTGLAGCATLVERVDRLEIKPSAERTIALKTGCRIDGKDVNDLYTKLRGLVIPQYSNPDARKDAEVNANMFTLGPTGSVGKYRSVVMQDANSDCIPSKGDFVFPDVVDGKERVGFGVGKESLPEELKFLLLDVTGGKK